MSDETLNTVEADTNTQENPREGGGNEERQVNKKGKMFFRKKVCRFCSQKAKIDYKDPDSLRRLLPNAERFYHAVLPELVRSISVSLRLKSSVRAH